MSPGQQANITKERNFLLSILGKFKAMCHLEQPQTQTAYNTRYQKVSVKGINSANVTEGRIILSIGELKG
jgi:hypothetical protein